MSNGIYASMTELQALNYVFEKNSLSLFTSNGVTDDYFTTYKEQYRFLCEYYKTYNQFPSKETFQARFNEDWAWLTVTDSEEYLISKLREAKQWRDVSKDMNTMIDLIKQEKTDKAIELMGKVFHENTVSSDTKCIDLVGCASQRYEEYLERVQNPSSSFVSTGLDELDDVLGGWDLKNESAIISARPGIGKSWLLVYFSMSAVKAGLRVGYYSGEMETDLIGYRFDTFMSNIANGSMTHGNAEIKEQYKNYIDNLQHSTKGKLFCIMPDDPMFNGSVTVDKLGAFIDKYDLQMLVVDQLSLLDDQRRAKVGFEQVANISKDLRKLQRIKKIPIIAASQLNREDTSTTGVGTRNIAGSDRVGQDATTVIALETKDDNLILSIIKARNAKSGDKLTYMWNKNMGILRFIPTENDARNGKGTKEELEVFQTDKSDTVF